MRKFLALMLVLLLASCAFAEADQLSEQQRNLGRDRAGFQWWLVNYGPDSSGWYAVAREYYTEPGAKQATINALSSRYGVPYDRASALYLTEYRFEYTSDGTQYTEVSRVFYDMLGEKICGYRTGHKVFNPVTPNTIQSKGAAYAMGRGR